MNRNRPVETHWMPGATRLFNLVIALLNSDGPRSVEWVLANVDGYQHDNDDSARRQLSRDRRDLAALGVHIGGTDELSLDPTQTFLPDIEFTDAEAAVIAAASHWAQSSGMHHAAQSAYAKLAAAGMQHRISTGEVAIPAIPDHTDLDGDSFDAIFRALDNGLVLSFNYYPSLVDTPQERRLEPWAFGAQDGLTYVTGFDPDRAAQRTFRLARIDSVVALPEFSQHPRPEGTPQQLIAQGLARSRQMVTATVEFPDDGAWELRRLTDDNGQIGPVERTWFVRTAAAYAPHVIVTSPPDLVADVVAVLKEAVK